QPQERGAAHIRNRLGYFLLEDKALQSRLGVSLPTVPAGTTQSAKLSQATRDAAYRAFPRLSDADWAALLRRVLDELNSQIGFWSNAAYLDVHVENPEPDSSALGWIEIAGVITSIVFCV